MDVTILQAIQISVWCLFTLRETVIISKTTHIKEKGATASGFTPLGTLVPLSCYFEGLYLAIVSISHWPAVEKSSLSKPLSFRQSERIAAEASAVLENSHIT